MGVWEFIKFEVLQRGTHSGVLTSIVHRNWNCLGVLHRIRRARSSIIPSHPPGNARAVLLNPAVYAGKNGGRQYSGSRQCLVYLWEAAWPWCPGGLLVVRDLTLVSSCSLGVVSCSSPGGLPGLAAASW